jgi:hypothetical protein
MSVPRPLHSWLQRRRWAMRRGGGAWQSPPSMVLRLLFPVLFLVLLTSLEGGNAARWGSGSAVDDGALTSGDLVPALNAETFNSSLLAAPANWALVEFYANWSVCISVVLFCLRMSLYVIEYPVVFCLCGPVSVCVWRGLLYRL